MATIASLNTSLILRTAGFTAGVTRAASDLGVLQSVTHSAARGMSILSSEAGQTESRLAGVARSAKGAIATLLGVATAAGAVSYGVKLAAEAEQTQAAFETSLKSAERAKQLIEEVRTFESATPLQLKELKDAARLLISYGTAQEQIIPTLRVLGDVAAGVHMPLGELATLYGRARIEGRIMAEDLNQLTGRGIPVIQEFAKQFGVAESEVRKLASEGKIGFSNLQQALISLTSEGGRFAGMMQRQAGTLGGLWSTYRSAVDSLFKTFGKAFEKSANLKDAIRLVTNVTNTLAPVARLAGKGLGYIAAAAIEVAKYLWPVVVFVKVFVVAAGLMFKLATAIAVVMAVKWVAALVGVRLGMLALNAAILVYRASTLAATLAVATFHALSGPQGWAILAAGAAIAAGAVYGIKKAYDSATASMESASDTANLKPAIEAGAATPAVDKLAGTYQRLKDAIAGVTQSIESAGLDGVQKKVFDLRKEIEAMNTKAGEFYPDLNGAQRQQLAIYEMQLRILEAKQAEADLTQEINDLAQVNRDLQTDIATATMTDEQERYFELQQKIEESNRKVLNAGGQITEEQQRQQRGALAIYAANLRLLTLAEQQADAQKRVADMQRAAAQEGMTAGQRYLDNLRRAGATQRQIAAAQADAFRLTYLEQKQSAAEQAKRLTESLKTPLDEYKKKLEDLTRLRKVGAIGEGTAIQALRAANKEYLSSIKQTAGKSVESPTALLKGSAEAALAEDRMKTPFEKLTDLQRQEVAEAKEANRLAREHLAWLQRNKPVTRSIN